MLTPFLTLLKDMFAFLISSLHKFSGGEDRRIFMWEMIFFIFISFTYFKIGMDA